ncbi:APC family permease [Flavobacterium sinopsychrotolerans]|jgi:APA family basic amino acid/polyamine antiporter|uniref:Amino acid/polyamine/organocation transporter, APC superfamily (TC 2.A.3) n=1 Tax=Flavobacterium sinopsychrotolerans TaxID=604089 RepID=A0A1H8KT92_9FLAO|nr:amino acid permease [Flavobacterium sinopsychrotolerans]SEN96130.1 amino acid/polyamine/organocation transporter, APC superfamily (TC 2.A.3) [Flavobacterium sinopsychrotolerans]
MSENKPELKRSLGLIDATSLVAGSMIGSGIFIVTSAMARDIGSAVWLLVIWLVTGLITVAAALSYGELAGMMPNAGGQFVYIQRAYGRLVSFLYGWTVFTVIQTGVIAAIAVTFANYAAIFFPVLDQTLFTVGTGFVFSYQKVLAIFSIILLTYINTKGVESGKTVQLIFTSAKLIALFALIVLGLYVGLQTNVLSNNFANMWEASKTVVNPDGTITVTKLAGMAILGAAGATIINSLFSSDAWNNVTFIAGEIKEPKKNIPRSLFLGTLIVTIIYVLANVAYLALLPMQGTPNATDIAGNGIMFASNDRVGAAAASMIMGNVGVFVMAALIMVSTFGCNSGLILSGGRLFFAMAKDGLFFKQATELNKNQVPAKALWVQCIWACVLCISGKFGDLLTYATFASLLFYILTILGVFILRKKEPNADRPYKAFGYPFVPAIYIIVTSAICFTLLIYDTFNTGLGLCIVALGIPVYYFVMNKKE